MVQINKRIFWILISLNFVLIIVLSFGINYVYSKIYWSQRVSIHAGINSEEYLGDEEADTNTRALIGQAYKIGTAFEVYKPTDPLLKVVSENHGALEFAVASGKKHFSDLARPRDAVIRKVGEGDLIFSIPSYTNKNVRSIIFGNESKMFMEFKNSDHLLINTQNLSLDIDGILNITDIRIHALKGDVLLSDQIKNLNVLIDKQKERIDSLQRSIQK